jgi:hypothetical protein
MVHGGGYLGRPARTRACGARQVEPTPDTWRPTCEATPSSASSAVASWRRQTSLLASALEKQSALVFLYFPFWNHTRELWTDGRAGLHRQFIFCFLPNNQHPQKLAQDSRDAHRTKVLVEYSHFLSMLLLFTIKQFSHIKNKEINGQ